MASEYYKYLARNEKPEAPPPPMTRQAKIKNWLHYNWYWLLIGAVILAVGGSMLWNALGIGKVRPDHVFAYVGNDPIPEEQAAAFENAVASIARDVNGDGRVVVELRQYVKSGSADIETTLYYGYAADTQLIADITKGDSYFFLAEDPDSVQRAYQIFANADGTAPGEDDYSADGKVLALKDCKALSSLLAGDSVFIQLSLGRRYFVGGTAGHEADAELWNAITEGARN